MNIITQKVPLNAALFLFLELFGVIFLFGNAALDFMPSLVYNKGTIKIREGNRSMKARMILDEKQRLVLLCADGTIAEVDDTVLYNLLMRFDRKDDYFSGGKRGAWRSDSYPEMATYPGRTIAVIADNDSLIINDSAPFLPLLKYEGNTTKYITTSDFAKRHDKSVEIVKVFCRNNRIPGAKKVGRSWLIPEDAEYPVDELNRREGNRGPRPHMRKAARQQISAAGDNQAD